MGRRRYPGCARYDIRLEAIVITEHTEIHSRARHWRRSRRRLRQSPGRQRFDTMRLPQSPPHPLRGLLGSFAMTGWNQLIVLLQVTRVAGPALYSNDGAIKIPQESSIRLFSFYKALVLSGRCSHGTGLTGIRRFGIVPRMGKSSIFRSETPFCR